MAAERVVGMVVGMAGMARTAAARRRRPGPILDEGSRALSERRRIPCRGLRGEGARGVSMIHAGV